MIKVSVAVIVDSQQRFLITQRPLHVPHGGCWEFPGGKVEINERPEQALIREVREEIGLSVLGYHYLGEVNHQYPDRAVQLLVFLVTKYEDEPSCIEGQLAMKWVNSEELNPADFPEANQEIISLILAKQNLHVSA